MASRKNSSRKTSGKPTIIESTATELRDEVSSPVAAPLGTLVTSNADGHVTMEALRAASQAGETGPSSEPEPASAPETSRPASGKGYTSAPASTAKPAGRGKWVAAGLAAALIAGIGGGGYLYHSYGQQLFGSGTASSDMAAIEAQVMDATGAAQSARQTADAVKAETAGLATRLDQRTSELQQNLDAVRQSVDALGQSAQTPPAQSGGEDLTALNQRLDELASKIEQLETTAPATSPPADNAEMSALRQQVASSEERISSMTSQLEALTSELKSVNEKLADRPAVSAYAETSQDIATLTAAVGAGTPYATELARLRERMALPAMPALDSNAATGIRSVAELDRQLEDIAGQLSTRAAESSTSSEGLWGALQSSLSKVVTVRSLDNPDWPAVIANARAALTTGGLDAAIAALPDAVTGMPQPLTGWLVEARKRVAATSELEQLTQTALSSAPAAGGAQ